MSPQKLDIEHNQEDKGKRNQEGNDLGQRFMKGIEQVDFKDVKEKQEK